MFAKGGNNIKSKELREKEGVTNLVTIGVTKKLRFVTRFRGGRKRWKSNKTQGALQTAIL